MVSALDDQNGVGLDIVDETLFVVYSTGPVPREPMLEWFRLADTVVRGSPNVLNQEVDPLEKLAFRLLPMEIVIPSVLGED